MSAESDATLDELRRRLTDGGPDRRGRYWAAMVSGPNSLDAVLRLVDAELADRASDDAKALERVRELADLWTTLDPSGLMSRVRAGETLREVLDR